MSSFFSCFFRSKSIPIGFMVQIRSQRLRINPCGKFQSDWTNDMGSSNFDLEQNRHTYFLVMTASRLLSISTILFQSTIMPNLVVIGIKEKQKMGTIQLIWFQKTLSWIGLRGLRVVANVMVCENFEVLRKHLRSCLKSLLLLSSRNLDISQNKLYMWKLQITRFDLTYDMVKF